MSCRTIRRPPSAARAPCGRTIGATLLPVLLLIPATLRAQGAPPTPVRTETVATEKVQEQRLVTGEVRSTRRSRVATREGGLVISIAAREGDIVPEDAPLARIDAERLEIQVRTVEAEEEQARAVLAERKADAEQRRRDLDALRDLSGRGASNPKELADAESAAAIAEARVAQAEAQIGIIGERRALLRKRLDDTEIRAPFRGLVATKHAEVGEWLGEGDPVVDLVSLDELEAWLEVPQAYLGEVERLARAGGPIRLRVGEGSDEIESRSYRLVKDLSPANRSFPLVLVLPKADGIAPGMSAAGWVPTGDEAEHVVISRDAVLRNETGSYVYAVVDSPMGEGKAAAPMPVSVLFGLGDRAVLRDGALRPGMQIVREGNERLYPMAPIAPSGGGPGGPGGGAGKADGGEPPGGPPGEPPGGGGKDGGGPPEKDGPR